MDIISFDHEVTIDIIELVVFVLFHILLNTLHTPFLLNVSIVTLDSNWFIRVQNYHIIRNPLELFQLDYVSNLNISESYQICILLLQSIFLIIYHVLLLTILNTFMTIFQKYQNYVDHC